MKNIIKITKALLLIFLLISYSCSDDDDPQPINLEDLVVTIDENPTVGQVIGTIQSDTSSSLTFSITTQSPTGALSIDTNTGEITVANAMLFDFETNPVITATITADEAVNDATITINLNNLEVIVQDLTVTIDENPTNGAIVGTLQTNGGSNFSITMQSPTGALNIDAATGELSVADAMLFDFETNPIITATITDAEATGTAVVTVNLTNVNEITIQDLTVAIDENPTNGDAIGTVQTTGGTALNFSITSQTPIGALSIHATTGELTVTDATIFDFETNPTITATITTDDAINTGTLIVNINDIDNILPLLSTSQSAYNTASIGDWVAVTEAEYDNIANNLNSITRAGTTNAQYNSATTSSLNTLNGSHTLSNSTTTSLIPANGYIVAFKYKMGTPANNVSGFKVKQSITANNSGFADLGSVLPVHSGTYFENMFFVLKGNSTPVTTNGYLGIFDSTSTLSLYGGAGPNGAYWGSSDTSNLNGTLNRNISYQGLSTTEIQW